MEMSGIDIISWVMTTQAWRMVTFKNALECEESYINHSNYQEFLQI
jgi:hypothetical protein